MNGRSPAAPERSRRSLVGFPVASAFYFLLSVVYFFPAFLPGRQLFGSDYLAGGFFFEEFISRQFSSGHLPGWVPFVYGGLPLHANPGSAYYPFRFLADLLFPVAGIWPALFVIQFTLAGIGMYLLARELEVRPWAAFVSGLAFEFTGLMMSWVLAGQEGRIIVATLAPLVFFFLHRAIRTGRFAWFAGVAASIGFALLSFQIQNAYYLLLASLIWSIFAIWHHGIYRSRARLTRTIVFGVGAVVFGFMLASVNFLPFYDYIDASPRAGPGRGYEYSTSFSMPVSEITAIAIPEQAGYLETYHGSNPFKLHTEYVGATVVLLLALGFYYARRNRHWWFFGGLSLFALSIAFGGNTPIYRIYYAVLPETKRFRAPSLAFFLVSLCLAAMAALTLEAMAREVETRLSAHRPLRGAAPAQVVPRPALWILIGVVVAGFLGGASAAAGPANPGPAAYRFAFFALLTSAVLWSWLRGSLSRNATVGLLAVLTVADLWVMDRHFFRTAPPPDQLFAADDVATFLRSQPGRDRVWVLPFPPGGVYRGQADDYLMHFGIDQAGGEHPDPLQRWLEYAGAGEQTMADWHNFLQYPAFLNAANVRYIVSGVLLDASGLRLAHQGASGAVYENPGALPRAYLVPRAVAVPTSEAALATMKQPSFDPARTAVVTAARAPSLPGGALAGNAEVVDYEPDRVEVRTKASRPALLVLADNYYDGWTARIDDAQNAEILLTDGTLRGVVVPAGQHTVVFHFEPTDLYVGLAIYLAGMALLALYALFLLVRWWRTRPVEEPAPA